MSPMDGARRASAVLDRAHRMDEHILVGDITKRAALVTTLLATV